MEQNVGIVGLGVYLPKTKMTAKEISEATQGVWSEDAVINKLGIVEKFVPSGEPCDGTQEMGALAALDCLKNTGVDPLEIDAILCITEEWKEYPLTTSACYVQDRIGAKNAWGVDVQNRCCTCVSAMKLAKDMLLADDEISMVLVCGGYRNCDLIDYTDKDLSFMYDLACGGGAILLKKGYGKNLLLGTHLMSDGSVVHTCGGEIGGIRNPVTRGRAEPPAPDGFREDEGPAEHRVHAQLAALHRRGPAQVRLDPGRHRLPGRAAHEAFRTQGPAGRAGHERGSEHLSRELRPRGPDRPDSGAEAGSGRGEGDGRDGGFHDCRRNRVHLGRERDSLGVRIR